MTKEEMHCIVGYARLCGNSSLQPYGLDAEYWVKPCRNPISGEMDLWTAGWKAADGSYYQSHGFETAAAARKVARRRYQAYGN